MNEHEFAELAAGHALHALSAEDEVRFAAALQAHPDWKTISDSDAETIAGLADGVIPVAPDAGVRDTLLVRIASTPQLPEEATDAPDEDDREPISRERAEPITRPRRLRILFTLAACLALVVGIGFGAVALNNQLNQPPSVVALEDIEASADAEQASAPLDANGSATVHWSAELGVAVLVADGLDSLEPEQTYQLWFIRGETPMPAGVFEPDAEETIAVLDGEMQAGDVIAVTVEPAGGSPTGLPTTDPIFAIPTA